MMGMTLGRFLAMFTKSLPAHGSPSSQQACGAGASKGKAKQVCRCCEHRSARGYDYAVVPTVCCYIRYKMGQQ